MENINLDSVPLTNKPPIVMEDMENIDLTISQVTATETKISLLGTLTIYDKLFAALEITYSVVPELLMDFDENIDPIEIEANTVCIHNLFTISEDVQFNLMETKKLLPQAVQSATFMTKLYQAWGTSFFAITQGEETFSQKFSLIQSLLIQEPLNFVFIYGDKVIPYAITSQIN